jgi:hypothetical protein
MLLSEQHSAWWVHLLQAGNFEGDGCLRSSGHDKIATAAAIVIVVLGRVEHVCRSTHQVRLFRQG